MKDYSIISVHLFEMLVESERDKAASYETTLFGYLKELFHVVTEDSVHGMNL